ncbi:MAG: HPr family phosphocarrier protein [Puniceicoccales bacterium]|jgi:phosphotransferase system HPr (HPr) family protein|nr:HPr family phosphocarrier protein [Puniceicoccales bacterium]
MVSQIQSQEKFYVKNRCGLHIAPAVLITKILNQYPEITIKVRHGDEQVNGKSIMELMMLEAYCDAELVFTIEGGSMIEQRKLIHELNELFDRKFFEDG